MDTMNEITTLPEKKKLPEIFSSEEAWINCLKSIPPLPRVASFQFHPNSAEFGGICLAHVCRT